MTAIIHPLLTLLASLTRQELAKQVTYLKAENQNPAELKNYPNGSS